MKALVTGGAGLIGSHIVDRLLRDGWDVVILDSLSKATHPAGRRPPWVPADAEFYQGDVRDSLDVALCMSGVDVVFHQAAFGGFGAPVRDYSDVNVGGTAVVMEAAQKAGVGKVVVASSQAVYGVGMTRCDDGYNPARRDPERMRRGLFEPVCPSCKTEAPTIPVTETQYLLPESPYALSKYHEEKLALELGAQWSLPVVALRYALTYGPRQSVTNPYTGICSIFATRLANGGSPVVYEDGLQTRDFTFVDDVAAANVLVATDDRTAGHVFNVGTGVATTVIDFALTLQRLIAEAQGRPCPNGLEYKAGAWRPQDVRHLVTDAGKLRSLGWEPQVDVEAGVRRYVEWFLDQPTPLDVFDVAEKGLIRDGIVVDVDPDVYGPLQPVAEDALAAS